jgi:hypothetical protein
MLITALLMTAALTGAPSPDGPDGEPDSVIATAPATSVVLDAAAGPVSPSVREAGQSTDPHGLSTDQQIAQWLTARASEPAPYGDSPVWRDDRKPHGEVSVGFGTGGYRDYAAAVSLPLGEGARLDISVRQVKNGYPYGYGYGYGYDPFFDDSGYAFSGSRSGAAIEYGSHVTRSGEFPRRWPTARPLLQAADD